MSYHPDDTICAISSAAGGAARGLVRLSGKDAIPVASRLFQANDGSRVEDSHAAMAKSGSLQIAYSDTPEPRDASQRPHHKLELPCEAFVWPTQRSYTGEPVVELHTVGSPPILQAVLAASCRAGARLAEPGEFTLRAFFAGRLDLTQVEAVLAVIDAPDRYSLSAALTQLAGGLARPLDLARNDLVQLLAELEAGLDFSEEDIRFISESEIAERLRSLSAVLDEVHRQLESRNTERDLPQIALVGPPNVGKSSLFNALMKRFGHRPGAAGRVVPALVSPRRGTTRDYLSTTITIGESSLELLDTAGLEANDKTVGQTIDGSAQLLTDERRKRANVRAYCAEASCFCESTASNWKASIPFDCNLVALTKADLVATPTLATRLQSLSMDVPVIPTSSVTEEGLAELGQAAQSLVAREISSQAASAIVSTSARCRESVLHANVGVRSAIEAAESSAGDEFVAAELRVALSELGKVVGAVYTDDLLDRIFKTFCIGK